MIYIDDVYYKKRLKEEKINIKTKYICGNNILERNTDNSYNDDIKNGIRCLKLYYKDGILVHKEKDFDSRIEYTFVSLNENDDKTCPNCGVTYKVKDASFCCPYCNTYYNANYINKDLGGKYHYDRILRSNIYRIVTFFVSLVLCTFLSFVFIKYISRTFNNYDIYKVFIYGFAFSLAFYYLFYVLDAYIVLGPIKRYKDKENERQIIFWNKTKIDKNKFFNNLNYELRKFCSSLDGVIDYDVIDYTNFDYKDGKVYVSAILRVVYLKNGKIKSKEKKYNFEFIENKDYVELKDGSNIIKCSGCSSSIDVLKR